MDKHIQVAAWSNIAGMIAAIATLFSPISFHLDIISTLFGAIGMYGFYRIGRLEKIQLLKIVAALVIIASVAYVAYDAVAVFPWEVTRTAEPASQEITQLGEALARLQGSFAVIGILIGLLGYSILALRKKFGNLALWTGVTGILAGASIVLMFGAPLLAAALNLKSDIPIMAAVTGMFLSLPAIAANWILEIVFLFKAAQKYK